MTHMRNLMSIAVKKWKRILIWSVVFCLVLAIPAYYWFYLARPVGAGPAGPSVSGEQFQQVWSERNVLLLGWGDSITAGFGMKAGYGFVERMCDNPPDEFDDMKEIYLRKVLPNITIRNLSVSGSTSLEHRQWLDTKLETQPDDVFGLVVMTTGGNDLIHSYGQRPPKEGAMYGATLEQAGPWIDNFRHRLDEMLIEITNKFPGGCVIFLADIYDPTDDVGDAASAMLPAWRDGIKILAGYNAILRQAAVRHDNVFAVPLHAAFLGHGTHCKQFWRKHYCWEDPSYWFGENLEDPNIRGFDAVRRIFMIEIAKEWKRFVE
ncbi:MAG: SGNH/GDSL hydrolase family protein [Planctomycetaceae bacterium]|nr:SGNH/GDSL hydrolase family protein [Planctomycetaceae bacterium]